MTIKRAFKCSKVCFFITATVYLNGSFLHPQGKQNADSGQFAAIDQHVLHTPPEMETSVDKLAGFLTKPAKNDLEKVRAIYRWITNNIAYDTAAYFSGKIESQGADNTLGNHKAVCEGYSKTFENLAKNAGLEAVSISGYSKGYGYKIGQSLPAKPDHAWNAVKINGKWFLLDSTWGAGYIDDSKVFVKKFNDQYFLTPPEEFISDHLPQDNKWQLLGKPVSADEFSIKVRPYSDFYRLGLKLENYQKAIIQTGNHVEITLTAPESVIFTSAILRDSNTEPNLSFVQRKGKTIYVNAAFPSKGNYKLRIFAKQKTESGNYNAVIEYNIAADSGVIDAGFPLAYEPFIATQSYLFMPMNRFLKTGERVKFKLVIPGAEQAAVVSNGKWTFLTRDQDTFSNDAEIQNGNTTVFAKFPGQTNFSGILLYIGR